MVLLLCGCGTSDSGQKESTEEPQAVDQVTETHYTEQQTEVANHNNYQGACINNGWIYSNGTQDDTFGFFKMRIDSSEKTLLHSEAEARFVTVNGEYIYTVLRDYSNDHFGIYRFRLGGDDEKELIANAATLQIVGDSMYYCKCKEDSPSELTQYCKSNLDGENEEVIIDEPVYFPYVIENTIFYQNDADNETIHKYDLETKEDTKITQEKTYGYTLDDDYLYCVVKDDTKNAEERIGTLVKVDLKTLESTTIYDGAADSGLSVKDNTLFFVNCNDEDRLYRIDKDGSNIGIVTQDDYVYHTAIFDDMLYYENRDSENYIDGFVMCKLDGSDTLDL